MLAWKHLRAQGPSSSSQGRAPLAQEADGIESFLLSSLPVVLMGIPGSQTAGWFMRRETGANQPHLMGPNYLGAEWLEPFCPFPRSGLWVPPAPVASLLCERGQHLREREAAMVSAQPTWDTTDANCVPEEVS